MSVTTANTIRLSNVCLEIYGSSNTSGKSLVGCHTSATGIFNSSYSKSGDTLLDFRGYNHNLAQLATPTVDITSVGLTTMNIVWNSISNSNNYKIQISANSNYSSATTLNTSSTSYTISNLIEDKNYFIRVQAQDTNNAYPNSNYGEVEGGTGAYPTPPYDLHVITNTYRYLKIGWSPGNNATTYSIRYRYGYQTGWTSYVSGVPGSSTTAEDGVEPGVDIHIQVGNSNQYGIVWSETLIEPLAAS